MTWRSWRRATPTKSAAYHFTYMLPRENRAVIEPYNEKDVPFESILPIGKAHDMFLPCSHDYEGKCLSMLGAHISAPQAMHQS